MFRRIDRVARVAPWRLLASSVMARFERLMTTDFCPWANGYVYWLKQPIGWFCCAALMSLLVGFFVGPQGFVLCAAISSVMVLGVVWPWVAMRAVRCGMSFPQRRAREGDPVRVELRVRNRFPWPVWGLSVEGGFADERHADGTARPALALAHVSGWSESRFQWEFRPPRRGVYPAEAPLLANGFPFGIWTARRPLEVRDQLLVWPRTMRLTSVPPVRGRQQAVAALASRRVGEEGDFLGVRPYRRGDSPRRIHWAQTARHDQLIVCERQASARRAVRIFVDAAPERHVGEGAQGSWEWSIRVAASLAEQFHAHGCSVEFVMGALRVSAAPGPGGIHDLLDQLALFAPSQSDPVGLVTRQTHDRQRPSVSRATRREQGCLSILVTTDKAWGPFSASGGHADPMRLVVLRAAAFDPARAGRGWGAETIVPWIELDDVALISTQLRRGWERVCHDGWNAI